uniref:Uncharacterized protein n=1 Tax=Plectus sambesii TaxID=2011161 RepID=A0A914X1C7_9BILA
MGRPKAPSFLLASSRCRTPRAFAGRLVQPHRRRRLARCQAGGPLPGWSTESLPVCLSAADKRRPISAQRLLERRTALGEYLCLTASMAICSVCCLAPCVRDQGETRASMRRNARSTSPTRLLCRQPEATYGYVCRLLDAQ